MTDTMREQISALLDSELSGQEIDQTIDRLNGQDELRETWGRYHLIGDVIRGETQGGVHPDVAEQVRQQLASEPAILAAPKPKRSHVEWISGAALAASVAVLAVMVAPQLLNPESETPSHIAAFDTKETVVHYPSSLSASPQSYRFVNSALPPRQLPATMNRPNARWYTQPSRGTRWKNLSQPAMQSKLNSYLVDHSEYAIQGRMKGVVPYATFVGYDAGR